MLEIKKKKRLNCVEYSKQHNNWKYWYFTWNQKSFTFVRFCGCIRFCYFQDITSGSRSDGFVAQAQHCMSPIHECVFCHFLLLPVCGGLRHSCYKLHDAIKFTDRVCCIKFNCSEWSHLCSFTKKLILYKVRSTDFELCDVGRKNIHFFKWTRDFFFLAIRTEAFSSRLPKSVLQLFYLYVRMLRRCWHSAYTSRMLSVVLYGFSAYVTLICL